MQRRDPRATVILDTNIFVYAQDFADEGHEDGAVAAEVLKAIGELGYTSVIAEATIDDLRRGGRYRERRIREAERYARVLPESPGDLRSRAGYGDRLSANDECDLQILAALDQGLAAWIITNDKRMIRHAERAGLTHVLDAQQFLDFLKPARRPEGPPPRVAAEPPGNINVRSPFFSSLTASYPEFHEWWETKVVPQKRTTLVVGEPEDPQALAVIKENDTDYGLPPDTTKICTFKVSDDARGQRYGELLLKASLQHIRSIPSTTAFLEVAPGNRLVKWITQFGFETLQGAQASNGDAVMVKYLTAGGRRGGKSPWEYHKTYGPGAVRVEKAFVVPIKPEWHQRLFPQGEPSPQQTLFDEITEPCGNAITKVYISHTRSRQPARGDVLLFVESGTGQRTSNIGVVEEVQVSQDPIDVLRFAGSRTVYTPRQVEEMCRRSEVHVMKFRHDRSLHDPWEQSTPGYSTVVPGPRQSITRVQEEGVQWLRNQLGG